MKPHEYIKYDGVGLAECIRKGETTRRELIDTALKLAEKHNPKINAICYTAAEYAQDQATKNDKKIAKSTAPFDGVPFLLKDLASAFKGWPETMGSRAYRNNISSHTDTLTQRFLDAGFNIFGRTTSPEFGAIGVTESALYGDTRNPWNINHTPGGSSGGAAACVAAGIVPLAHASDGGGSIRIPASCAGLVGLKPSRGRNPTGPIVGEQAAGLSVSHVVSRSVRDTAITLDAISGYEVGDIYTAPKIDTTFENAIKSYPKSLKIACYDKYWDSNQPTDPECAKAIAKTAKLLTELGHTTEENKPKFDYNAFIQSFGTLWAAVATQRMEQALANGAIDDFEPFYRELAEFGKNVSGGELLETRENLFDIARITGRFHETYDILVTPVLGIPPLRIGEWERKTARFSEFSPESRAPRAMLCTPVANVTGQPAISLPLHMTDDGLPVGVMFVAAYGRDDLLLQLAAQLENVAPWRDLTPPIWG